MQPLKKSMENIAEKLLGEKPFEQQFKRAVKTIKEEKK